MKLPYKVLQGFRQAGRQFNPGDDYPANEHDAKPLLMQKLIGKVEVAPKKKGAKRRGS